MQYQYIRDPNKRKDVPTGYHRTANGISNSDRWNQTIRKQLKFSLNIVEKRPCSPNLKLITFTSCHVLKSHREYSAAKHGDYFAAQRLVRDIIRQEKLARLSSIISLDDLLLPVVPEQASGGNRIPWALAKLIGQKTGAAIYCCVHQIIHWAHTAQGAVYRILTPEIFVGSIKKHKRYILIDDHTTSGGTFSSLASYIEANDGEIKFLISISSSAKVPMSDKGYICLSPAFRFSEAC